MRPVIAAVVDLAALWKILVAVFIAGVGVSHAVVALAGVVRVAALVIGFIAMTHK